MLLTTFLGVFQITPLVTKELGKKVGSSNSVNLQFGWKIK